MHSGHKRRIRTLSIGFAFSAAFLYLALRNIQWSEFSITLKTAKFVYLIPSVFFVLLGHYLRAYRWRFMLLPVKPIGTASLFSFTTIGFMANNLLPVRMGEVVRAYVLAKTESISMSSSFATIVYERIVDVFVLLVLLWFALFHSADLGWLKAGGLSLLLVNIALLVLLIIMEKHQERTKNVIDKLAARLPEVLKKRVLSVASAFLEGLKVIRNARAAIPISLLSIPVWLCALLGIYFCLLAMNLHLPYFASITLIVLIILGSAIPSAPAYVGTLQYACILGLTLFDIGKDEALAFSLLYHATQFFPVTILGFCFLWKSHIALKEIARKEKIREGYESSDG